MRTASPPREVIGEGLCKGRGHHVGVAAEDRLGIRLDGRNARHHLHGVRQDIQMVIVALLHATALPELRDERCQPADVVKQREGRNGVIRPDDATELLHHPLTRGFAYRRRGVTGSVASSAINGKPKGIGNACEPDDAHWVVGERRIRDQCDAGGIKVGDATVAVHEVRMPRHRQGERVDGEVAPREILIKRATKQRHDIHLPRQRAPSESPGPEAAGQPEATGSMRP